MFVNHQFINEHKNVIPDTVPGTPILSLASRLSSLVLLLLLAACSDFFHPVKSTPEPTEYSFNYWLLQRQYLFEDELVNLPEDGDSVQVLYKALKDPYTQYVPPSKSEAAVIRSTTSMVEGDVGMRYFYNYNLNYPIIITRVYPQGPAGRAGIPRNGRILEANGIELTGESAKTVYDSIINYSKNVNLLIAYKGDTTLYELEKETIYAPTVFVDTLYKDSAKGYPGIIIVSIEAFKIVTADRDSGTYGELKTYLIESASDKRVRVLDLRNNPGGHVSQCIDMADLFSKEGTLSTRRWRSVTADGGSAFYTSTETAKAGDPGESGKFLILANRGSASCTEIFIAAVTETTDIPFVGGTTYGKGIGQTMFYTYENGLAKITDLEFITPKGNSYHGVGIVPKYECEGDIDTYCAAKIANKLYGVKIPEQSENALEKRQYEQAHNTTDSNDIYDFGGAYEWGVYP